MSTSRSRSHRASTMISEMGERSAPTTHPIFQAAAEYVNDEEWKKMLLDAANGKFPTNFMMDSSGYLMYKKRGATKVVHDKVLLSSDPMVVAEDFVKFVKVNAKHYSETDYVRMKQEYELRERPKNRKYKVSSETINKYADACQKAWGMTPSQTTSLKACIQNGFNNGILDAYSVVENDVLLRVDNILYNDHRDYFYIDPAIICAVKVEPHRIRGQRLYEPKLVTKKYKMKSKVLPDDYIPLDRVLCF